jgi:hypothetical protein
VYASFAIEYADNNKKLFIKNAIHYLGYGVAIFSAFLQN